MAASIAAPTRAQLEQLGNTLSKGMEPVCTWPEIAAEFGITRTGAMRLTHTALGRLAFNLRMSQPMEAFDD